MGFFKNNKKQLKKNETFLKCLCYTKNIKFNKYVLGGFMKKKFLTFLFAICLILPCAFMLTACGTNPLDIPTQKDYNADIQEILPELIDDEHFEAEDNTTYYTSPGFSLSISIRGHFMIMERFPWMRLIIY